MKIFITENPAVEGYDGAFYRFTSEDGQQLATGIWDIWFEARAVDEDGGEYNVVWKVSDKEALESGDEDCCDWECPAEVYSYDECRSLPLDSVELDWSKV